MKLEGIRDVIEWQLDDVLDINGWDLKKVLQLLHKSNPTVFEWCASPIVYYQTEEFEKLKKILPEFFSVKKSLFHYWHMAETHYREYLKGEEVRLNGLLINKLHRQCYLTNLYLQNLNQRYCQK